MNARGSGRTYGPSSADAYQLDLDQVAGSPRAKTRFTVSRESHPVHAPAADPVVDHHEDTELSDAHEVLDALSAGGRDQTLVKRLRRFIERAAGERAAAALNPDFGMALARYHLERSGHPEGCPCNPCRQARLMR